MTRPDTEDGRLTRSGRARPILAFGIAVLALAMPAAAHDFWIDPATFRPAPGQTVAVNLRVGDGFPGEELPREERRVVQFELLGPSGSAPVVGVEGRAPAGAARIGSDGAYALLYRSTDSRAELPPDQFDAYLGEEGLEAIRQERLERGEGDEPGRELFSRSVKALVSAGEPGSLALHSRAAGLPLELVPGASPYDGAAPLDRLPLVLLHDGAPLAGTLVRARRREEPGEVQEARTDPSGRVVLDLAARGMWLVTAVHMDRAPADSGADWRSVWTSLTFDTAEATEAAGTADSSRADGSGR